MQIPALPQTLTDTGRDALTWMAAVGAAARRIVDGEWRGSQLHLMMLNRAGPDGLGATPRDFRPLKPDAGRDLLAGVFRLGGHVLELGPQPDPWNRSSPTRRFAQELHRFSWLRELVAAGEDGPRQALRLTLEWERVFGRWNSFAWNGDVLERRVFNLACCLKRLTANASDAERSALTGSLARQARHLLALSGQGARSAEGHAVAAVAANALAGTAMERLAEEALARLDRALPAIVLPDGGHASRSPEAALQLLFDLFTLDDVLLQMGRPPPDELVRAIDRLAGALRFFTLPDGRLASFQGGEESNRAEIDAARARDDSDAPASMQAPHSGYEKMIGGSLHVIVDAGPPASGALAVTACAHPLAMEVVCGHDRLISNSGWSPHVSGSQALRLTPASSTAALADGTAGSPMRGFRGRNLGPRLVGGAQSVGVRRHDAGEGVWLELSHDGWAHAGLTHERRLYLDIAKDELRGEDRFVALAETASGAMTFSVRFHVHPEVKASLARDQRSVLLQAPSAGGWWLRNDAAEVVIEPSVNLLEGRGRRTVQVVLRSQVRAYRGGRVRWKLAHAEPGAR